MTHSVVHRQTCWECNTPFNLLLYILVHVPSLPILINSSNITSNSINYSSTSTHNLNKLDTYSRIYESPFSQRSTILALGLHSDNTNCNASAPLINQYPPLINITTKTAKHNNARARQFQAQLTQI